MIIVKLIGGLGNQMFQYAAATALARKHGVEVKVDTGFLEQDAKGEYTQRHFELPLVFDAKFPVATRDEVDRMTQPPKIKFVRTLKRYLPRLFTTKYVIENGHRFQKSFFSHPADVYIQGYWQNELYFKACETEIRKIYTFKGSIMQANRDWADKINAVNSLSLHIRRGDYVKNPAAQAFHGLCSVEYYNAAVKQLSEKNDHINIFVFSDDLDWCRENLAYDMPVHFVDTGNAHSDLYLMSLCKHNVIANSSFSWWGAWLNANPGKTVIAPRQWFANGEATEVIPDNWIRL